MYRYTDRDEPAKCQHESRCCNDWTSARTARGTAVQDLRNLRFKCPKCDTENTVTPENIIIHIYSQQPFYNTVEFQCSCWETWHLFGMNEIVFDCDWEDFCVEIKQYADEDTIKGFAKVYFNDVLPEHKEAQVSFFHLVLEDIQDLADIDWGQE